MKLFLNMLIIGFVIFGILLSLIAIYASEDGKAHFLEASYFWIGSSIGVLSIVLLSTKRDK